MSTAVPPMSETPMMTLGESLAGTTGARGGVPTGVEMPREACVSAASAAGGRKGSGGGGGGLISGYPHALPTLASREEERGIQSRQRERGQPTERERGGPACRRRALWVAAADVGEIEGGNDMPMQREGARAEVNERNR